MGRSNEGQLDEGRSNEGRSNEGRRGSDGAALSELVEGKIGKASNSIVKILKHNHVVDRYVGSRSEKVKANGALSSSQLPPQLPPPLRHLAIIMDGNGRWAKARGKSRIFGHRAGATAAKKVLDYALNVGIPYLTLFAFSSENWRRPKHEVEGLMLLLEEYLDNNRQRFLAGKRVRLNVFGDKQGLPKALCGKLEEIEEESKDNIGLDLGIALNYGGRAEILRATKKLIEKCLQDGEKIENIDEDMLASQLDTARFPDPDLLLRTGGEKRISNFMLWQSAYTEMIFTDCPWPDFDEKKLEEVIVKFSSRVRRFGASPEAEAEKKQSRAS